MICFEILMLISVRLVIVCYFKQFRLINLWKRIIFSSFKGYRDSNSQITHINVVLVLFLFFKVGLKTLFSEFSLGLND